MRKLKKNIAIYRNRNCFEIIDLWISSSDEQLSLTIHQYWGKWVQISLLCVWLRRNRHLPGLEWRFSILYDQSQVCQHSEDNSIRIMDLVWLSNQSSELNWTDFGIMEERPNFEAIPAKYHPFIILLYSCTAVFALLFNLLTLIVLAAGNSSSKNLSKLLVNLSCADILMATFSIPFTYTMFMYGQWFFAPQFCPIVIGAQFYSVFISVYTLVAIGINR